LRVTGFTASSIRVTFNSFSSSAICSPPRLAGAGPTGGGTYAADGGGAGLPGPRPPLGP
jgi:hypothetical protein